jgi:hypothetical protein
MRAMGTDRGYMLEFGRWEIAMLLNFRLARRRCHPERLFMHELRA